MSETCIHEASSNDMSNDMPTQARRIQAALQPRSNGPRRLVGVALAAALMFTACGSDSVEATTEAGSNSSSDNVEDDDAGPAVIQTASSDLGDILVGSTGVTVYGFTNDSKGVSNCEGDCAVNWPPVMSSSAELPAGLDASVFSVLERSDGGFQLQAGDWPLYFFAGDSVAGDTNGQAVGDVWFVVDPTGGLVK